MNLIKDRNVSNFSVFINILPNNAIFPQNGKFDNNENNYITISIVHLIKTKNKKIYRIHETEF